MVPIVLWIAAVLVAPAAAADAPAARFRRLTTQDGLSHGHVLAIAQDAQGFLWFGTELGGLNRYDGVELKVYRRDLEDAGSLAHDFVWVLYEDRARTLWIGTNGGGLDRYDRARDAFVHHRHDPLRPDSLPHDNVKSLYEDAAGTLWVGTDGGLSRLDRVTGTFVTYRHDAGDPTSLGDDSVRSIVEDTKSGKLWLGTRRGGASRLDPRTGRFEVFRHAPNDARSLASDAVSDVLIDSTGRLWLGTARGLDRFDAESASFAHHQHDPRDPGSLADDAVARLHEDRQGRLWVATRRGLDQLDPATRRFHHYRHNPYDPESLAEDDAWSLYEDDTGALWVGGANAGVSRLPAEPARFARYRHDPSDARSLSGSAVQAALVDQRGRLWVGTTKGLNRQDGDGGFTRFRHRAGDPRSLPHDDVRALAEDGAGRLWVGTNGGLCRVDDTGTTRYPSRPQDPDGLAGPLIDALHAGPSGLWIAVHGVGLDHFDGRTFTHYGPSEPAPRTLPTHYVLHVLEHPRGTVWLATNAQGLLRLDVQSSAVSAFPLDPDHPTSESANRVHVLHVGADGALWLGTESGLHRFDPAAARYTHRYTVRDGLPANGVVSVAGDDRGHLWLSTLAGLSRFDPRTGQLRHYDRADSLFGNQFSWRAHARAADGRLFFGGNSGLAAFHPDQLTDNPHVPPVVLTAFELFDQPMAPGRSGSPLREAIHLARTIELHHGQSSFSLRFAALDYAAPHRNQYEYRMEGFDADWRATRAPGRSATYTNLDPGRYVFRVRGSNNDGVWNREGAALTIVVHPPWWGTWWFRGLALAALAGLVWGGHRVRVRTLEERERRFRMLAENAPDVVVRLDRQLRYLYANPAAEEHTGIPAERFLGRTHTELGLPAAKVELWDSALREVIATGRDRTLEFDLETPKGVRALESHLVPERDRSGNTASVLVITRDVTSHKVLLKELHHRVKNNLQIVSSLLSLQSQHVPEASARAVLQDSHSRVRSMALIHEKLFQSTDLARVEARDYVRSLVGALFASYGANRYQLETVIDVDDVSLGVDTAIPCGLLINELVSNALKHAFPDGRPGRIEVQLRAAAAGGFTLRVGDNGVGFPERIDFRHTDTLGLQLVSDLTVQLGGTIELRRGDGTTFDIRFSEVAYRDRL